MNIQMFRILVISGLPDPGGKRNIQKSFKAHIIQPKSQEYASCFFILQIVVVLEAAAQAQLRHFSQGWEGGEGRLERRLLRGST